jgi:hypothetical protein
MVLVRTDDVYLGCKRISCFQIPPKLPPAFAPALLQDAGR